LALPSRQVLVSAGLYGDLRGTLSQVSASTPDMVASVLEWPDLDPRLGFRHLGGWGPNELNDILQTVDLRLRDFRDVLERIPNHVQLAISLPTLPLPPVFYTPACQLGSQEQRLSQAVMEFGAWALDRKGVRLVNPRYLSHLSPPAQRFDFKGDLLTGIPYTLSHSDQLASCLAKLLVPPPPKKGLITDLDETLWSGIAGEVGAQAVSWDLAGQAQTHGLYQQLLRALAQQGVLLAVASKNAAEVVEEAFQRSDMLVPRDYLFPMEVNWGAKSESVARILQAWNISAGDVVFVDDSGSELAEVQRAFPDLECVLFPAKDYAATCDLLYRLRDIFGKQQVLEEDGLRRASLREGASVHEEVRTAGSYEEFMREARSEVTFDLVSAAQNPRSLELVNKTNQFNLNGIRYTESEWQKAALTEGSFVMAASYVDKYGALGTIAVLRGQVRASEVAVDTWVMSCRAFGRRIEHQCLRTLLEHFGAASVRLDFAPTARNRPLQEFFSSLLGEKISGPFEISGKHFRSHCPPLYHKVTIQA
jgi:FkbH-like protein